MHETIPIVLASSNEYVKAVATVITSTLINSNKDINYEFNILTTAITEENKNKLSEIQKKFSNSNIKVINLKDFSNNKNFEKLIDRNSANEYFSIETFYRLYIPQIFINYQKILYLDCDLLILKNIEELYDENISDYCAGIIEDIVIDIVVSNNSENVQSWIKTKNYKNFKDYLQKKLHKKNLKYFNSGVLLLNLDKIREEGIIEKCWDFLYKESPLIFVDQDVLNSVLEGKVKYLDNKWNVEINYPLFARLTEDKNKKINIINASKNPGIVHFIGPDKPWLLHNDYKDSDFVFEWWKYFSQTPFWTKEEHLKLMEIAKRKSAQKSGG